MAFNPHLVWVVIPTFNEHQRIQRVIQGVYTYTPHIIVVDDGSQDTNLKQLTQEFPFLTVLTHDINLGKGAAMKTGCDFAVSQGAHSIIVMDADGQHVPSDIPRFIEKLKTGKYDLIFGARVIGKNMPLLLFLGNKFLSICINLFFRVFISDTQGGFRAFTSDAYKKIRWESADYRVETEMIVNAAKHHLRYTEIEIQTIYHDKYKGTTPLDGLKIFTQILKWRWL